MIDGASDVVRLFSVLVTLGVVDVELDITRAATFVVANNGHKMSESSGKEDIYDDMTEEEMKIMNACNPGYQKWYEDGVIDNIIFGEDEE